MLNCEVIAHLYSVLEAERTLVARELHDDVGALLVAAAMDVAATELHLNSPAVMRSKLQRVQRSLATAIDLKRHLIEELRPSLLDNFGLFAALRWRVQESCEKAGVVCTQTYPGEELPLTADALTGLFRIVQEALLMGLKQPAIRSLAVEVSTDAQILTIQLACKSLRGSISVLGTDHIAMDATTHRVWLLGGSTAGWRTTKAGRVLTVHIPLARVLAINGAEISSRTA